LDENYVIRHIKRVHSLPTAEWCLRFGHLLQYIPNLSEEDSLIGPSLDGWCCSVPGCDLFVTKKKCDWKRHVGRKDHYNLPVPPTLQKCKYRKSICGHLIRQQAFSGVHASVVSLNLFLTPEYSDQQVWAT
jgi:hypothetical protein